MRQIKRHLKHWWAQETLLLCLWLCSAALMADDPTIDHPGLIEATDRAQQADYEKAEALVDLAILEGAPQVQADWVRAQIVSLRQAHRDRLEQEIIRNIESQSPAAARVALTEAVALGLEQVKVESLRRAIDDVNRYGAYTPGQVFQDSISGADVLGPLMVVIPEGQFMMGSSASEVGREEHEGPRHRVVIGQGFALGRYEITVAEFQRFVEATGYRTDAERRGRSRVYDSTTGRIIEKEAVHWRQDYRGERAALNLPVVHVSWQDAVAYARWLSETTGQTYRLPSEAEFEYALRAGSQWRYPWGQDLPEEVLENLAGGGDVSTNGMRWARAFRGYRDGVWGPSPVGQFKPNAFGLFDLGGNVMEWTADCWHDSYVRAPADGSAWVNRGCPEHVVRGGCWASTPELARSAHRQAVNKGSGDVRIGFRVVREIIDG